MIPLYNQEEFDKAPWKNKFLIQCENQYCSCSFLRSKKKIKQAIKDSTKCFCSNTCSRTGKKYFLFCEQCFSPIVKNQNHIKYKKHFCSRNCFNLFRKKSTKISFNCSECNKSTSRFPSSYKKSKEHFCCRKCAQVYWKRVGITFGKRTNRSKLEIWLEKRLKNQYPNHTILFNDKKTLNGLELDIYFPEIKLAIELNGPTHYKPIYGNDKLEKTQHKDNKKMILCLRKGIDLHVYDVCKINYRKDEKSFDNLFDDLLYLIFIYL